MRKPRERGFFSYRLQVAGYMLGAAVVLCASRSLVEMVYSDVSKVLETQEVSLSFQLKV